MSKDSKDGAKVKKILDECLKQPDNKTCSECGMKQPRWASTNLGIFMCIRCSGIHRNLGVHISKVKSVSLDTWPLEQAEFMATMGNEKSNAIYEHSMPSNRKPNENDAIHLIEQFIRDKYDKVHHTDTAPHYYSAGGGGGGGGRVYRRPSACV